MQDFLISSKREMASIGLDRGDVEKDEEGLRTMRVLGEKMVWMMKRLCAGRS